MVNMNKLILETQQYLEYIISNLNIPVINYSCSSIDDTLIIKIVLKNNFVFTQAINFKGLELEECYIHYDSCMMKFLYKIQNER